MAFKSSGRPVNIRRCFTCVISQTTAGAMTPTQESGLTTALDSGSELGPWEAP